MAYLRILRKDGRRYFYIMKSVRKDDRVLTKTLEYLGREPDPRRLKRALQYWGVKTSSGKRGFR